MDISLNSFSVCILKVPPEGSMYDIFYSGPSFHFMAKKTGNFFSFYSIQISTIHKIKTRA